MARARKGSIDEVARVRHLIALDAANVMARLRVRMEEMVTLFSRLRDREPLLTVIDSVVPSATFAELALLSPDEQRAVNEFYELLGDLRWYMKYTEDMPLQLQGRVVAMVAELEANYRLLSAVIGRPRQVAPTVIEVELVNKLERRSGAIAHRKRPVRGRNHG
jgi:hypothetical protein